MHARMPLDDLWMDNRFDQDNDDLESERFPRAENAAVPGKRSRVTALYPTGRSFHAASPGKSSMTTALAQTRSVPMRERPGRTTERSAHASVNATAARGLGERIAPRQTPELHTAAQETAGHSVEALLLASFGAPLTSPGAGQLLKQGQSQEPLPLQAAMPLSQEDDRAITARRPGSDRSA